MYSNVQDIEKKAVNLAKHVLLPNVRFFLIVMIQMTQLLDSLKSFEVSPGTQSEGARSRAYKQVPRLQYPYDIDTLNRKAMSTEI